MKTLQLFCIGYAGSTASAFRILQKYLPETILLTTIEYAGRGTRNKEPFYQDCKAMVQDVAEQIKRQRQMELPYAMIGYSMGVQVIYELYAKKFLSEPPRCIFLAAHEPPDDNWKGKSVSLENDRDFFEQMRYYGGIDERFLLDRRFQAIYGERLKADFKMLQEYHFSGEYVMLPSKTVVLYCEKDTPLSVMSGWSRFAGSKIKFHEMGESHFFFKTDTEKFCQIIWEELQ